MLTLPEIVQTRRMGKKITRQAGAADSKVGDRDATGVMERVTSRESARKGETVRGPRAALSTLQTRAATNVDRLTTCSETVT